MIKKSLQQKLAILIIILPILIIFFYFFEQTNKFLALSRINQERIIYLDNEIEKIKISQEIGDTTIEQLVEHLKVYNTYNNNLNNLIRLGKNNDGGYVIPELALKESQALIGYGIRDDISFEEGYSNKYNNESFGFDCSIENIKTSNNLTRFIPECIGTTKYLDLHVKKRDSLKLGSFKQHIEKLNLRNKKIFVKMDIEGAEYETIPEILQHASNITGIALEIHFSDNVNQLNQALTLLKLLDKDFVLTHIHGCNCARRFFTHPNIEGRIPRVIELLYINKSIIDRYEVSSDQSHPSNLDMPVCLGLKDENFTIKLAK